MLKAFEEKAGIRFRNHEFLNLSFFHRSLGGEANPGTGNNERLEFLGDSVLGLVISDYLFCSLPDRAEGELAKIKSYVVSEDTLSEVSLGLGVDKLLVMGKGEELSGGRAKKAILADALEACIGALYLDQGFEAAEAFVLSFCRQQVAAVLDNRHRKDYKTLLQEYSQKELKIQPRYQCLAKEGPDHAKVFTVEVVLGNDRYGPSRGNNKKEAEQGAARIAWERIMADRPV